MTDVRLRGSLSSCVLRHIGRRVVGRVSCSVVISLGVVELVRPVPDKNGFVCDVVLFVRYTKTRHIIRAVPPRMRAT